MHDELDEAVLVPLQARKLLVLGARVGELMPGRLNSGRLADQPVGSFEDHDADSGGEAEHAAGEQHVPGQTPA